MAGLFQPVLQQGGAGQVATEGAEQPSVAAQVAPVAIQAIGGLASMFGERKKAKGLADVKMEQDKALSRYNQQLLQISEMGRTSNVGSSALLTKKTNLTMSMLRQHPELTSDIMAASKAFGQTPGFGKMIAEGTPQEQAELKDYKDAYDANYIRKGMSKEEEKEAVVDFKEAEWNKQELARITQKRDMDEKVKVSEQKTVVGRLMGITNAQFSRDAKMITENFKLGLISFEEAEKQIDNKYSVLESTARTLGDRVGQGFMDNQLASVTRIMNNTKGYLSGTSSLEQMSNSNKTIVERGKIPFLQNEEFAHLLALSDMVNNSSPQMLSALDTKGTLITGQFLGIVPREGGSPLKEGEDPLNKGVLPQFVAYTEEGRVPFQQAYNYLVKNIAALESGNIESTPKLEREFDISINRIAKGLNVYQFSIDHPKQLKDIVSFFGNPTLGKYIEKSGGMEVETLRVAQDIIKSQYTDKYQQVFNDELFQAVVLKEAPSGRGIVSGDSLMKLINTNNTKGVISFTAKPEMMKTLSATDKAHVQNKIQRLQKTVGNAVNEMVRVGAHLEGNTDYEKFLNNNLNSLLGLPSQEEAAKLKIPTF